MLLLQFCLEPRVQIVIRSGEQDDSRPGTQERCCSPVRATVGARRHDPTHAFRTASWPREKCTVTDKSKQCNAMPQQSAHRYSRFATYRSHTLASPVQPIELMLKTPGDVTGRDEASTTHPADSFVTCRDYARARRPGPLARSLFKVFSLSG